VEDCYAAGSFDGDGPIVCIKLAASNAGRVRSHFERLISAEQVVTFATVVVVEAAALAKGAEEDARRVAGGKKLAQKESNAAQAHGLKGPLPGTSSGVPSAPPPPPSLPFDHGLFCNGGKKLAKKENNAAQAHGLKAPLTGTSSGAPSAPPPPPPPPFDHGLFFCWRQETRTEREQCCRSTRPQRSSDGNKLWSA
jgi:hypothetical protein